MIPAKLKPENAVDSSATVDPETSGPFIPSLCRSSYIVTNYARNGPRMLQAVADVLSKRCIRAPSCKNEWYRCRMCPSFVCPFWGLTLSQCVVTKMRFFVASCPPTSLNLSWDGRLIVAKRLSVMLLNNKIPVALALLPKLLFLKTVVTSSFNGYIWTYLFTNHSVTSFRVSSTVIKTSLKPSVSTNITLSFPFGTFVLTKRMGW